MAKPKKRRYKVTAQIEVFVYAEDIPEALEEAEQLIEDKFDCSDDFGYVAAQKARRLNG